VRIDSFLEQSAVRTPDKTALVNGSRRLTYAELDRLCDRLAGGFGSLGVQRGDRVAVFLETGVEAVVAVFGTLKADAVFVMINPTTKLDKLALLLNDCRATALVTDARRLPLVPELLTRVHTLRSVVIAGCQDVSWDYRSQVVAFDALVAKPLEQPLKKQAIDVDLAALLYTSGSTGRPKGVMLTHRNMVSAATSITTYLENRADDVVLNVLPLSFDYGLYQVLMTFQFGGTVVLERSFTYLHTVLETIARERVTGFPVVPTIAALLLQHDLDQYDFSSLRYITSTGAALPQAHINELRALLPNARLFSMYGLTECKRVSFLPPDDLDRKPGSVGRGMPNEEVYLVDEDGQRVECGIGELVVRGAHVMQGYWEQPEETARMLRPGPLPGELVLYTGDMFRIDEDGYLYFVARKDDMIKTRGEKVSPREVEDVLHRLEGVAEAAVIGVPDGILGQAVKAVIALRPGATVTEQDVYRHCGRYLEDFMVPHAIDIRETLPRTANGKRDYKALINMASIVSDAPPLSVSVS
jgi:long-chain acyl-CoA synthetase